MQVHRSGIAGPRGEFTLNFLRNCPSVSQRDTPQPHMEIPVFSHPHQHLFFTVAILVHMQWFSTVVLISPIVFEKLCLLAIGVFLKKYLLNLLAIFKLDRLSWDVLYAL